MSLFETVAAVLTLAAALAYVNHRWLDRPMSIALMAMTLLLSLAWLGAIRLGWVEAASVERLLGHVNLDETLLHGMLGALLFAGALHIPLEELREQRVAVSVLALAGTLLSTFTVALLVYLCLPWLGHRVPFAGCLLFGAVISPTDPVAVLAVLKQARVPRALEIQISGESLFNDGVGVVLFATVLLFVREGAVTPAGIALAFLREAGGGALFGLASGYVAFRLLRSIDHYQTELLITLALVLGGYAAAERLHVSAPLASVVAGIVIGNHGRREGMSDITRDHLDKFWSLVDDTLNAVLFVLLGLEVVQLEFTRHTLLAGVLAVPCVLLARFVSVALPIKAMRPWYDFTRGTVRVLTWGGLRGGISVALALSLPAGRGKDPIVTMTYFVVAFSTLVQGLTLGRVARRFGA